MSNDSFSEVTSQSWGSRLGSALKGIIVGVLLVGVALVLLFWNEGRAVKRHKTLKEGGGAVLSVAADAIDAANQGRLVHLSGLATTEEHLTDPSFAVSGRVLKLQRSVEMYQWREESRSEEKKKLGGGTETVTTYTYSKTWSERVISSSQFKQPEGHHNPAQMPYRSEEFVAEQITVGAFTLSPAMVQKLRDYAPLRLEPEYTLPEPLKDRASLVSNSIFLGREPHSPQIGDLRVSFQVIDPMRISLVASQLHNTLEPYQASTGGSIALLQPGDHSAEAMFQQARQSNTILTWVLRGGGFVLMLIGFQLILAPLAVFADVLPVLGSLVEAGTGLVAGLISASLSCLTVAVAWLVYRPVLAGILLLVSGGISILLLAKLRKTPSAPTATPPPPPPAGSPSAPGPAPPPYRGKEDL